MLLRYVNNNCITTSFAITPFGAPKLHSYPQIYLKNTSTVI